MINNPYSLMFQLRLELDWELGKHERERKWKKKYLKTKDLLFYWWGYSSEEIDEILLGQF